jgi:uncharacterized OB-fold protein
MPSSDGQNAPAARIELADRWRPGPPPVLLAARCRSCGAESFPPRPQCPECWQPADTVALPRRGTLYTFTTIHAGGKPSRTLGYADFGEVRVLGPLTGGPPRIGTSVEVTETAGGTADDPARRYAFRVEGP